MYVLAKNHMIDMYYLNGIETVMKPYGNNKKKNGILPRYKFEIIIFFFSSPIIR